MGSAIDHSNQTGRYYPCLDPAIFNPVDLDPDQWMRAAKAMGVGEICLTAKHYGGFAMWQSNVTNYGVSLSRYFRGGKGDVLREFADSANRWGVKICYYINPLDDGYMALVENVTADVFMERSKGMLREVLEKYGPVHRLWFDGEGSARPASIKNSSDYLPYYDEVFEMIRDISPKTLLSPYRGDVCSGITTLYTGDFPPPRTNNASKCAPAKEGGKYFRPFEMHGITMQEGPDGNTDDTPTYWFWHPWACARNITGCPWVGHANASRMFEGYIATVGHGGVLNTNIAPDASGRLNASVVEVMIAVGQAINATFKENNAGETPKGVVTSGSCGEGVAVVDVTGPFDYIVTMEDLAQGQRIGNYSIEYRERGSAPNDWKVLVPPVVDNKTKPLGDRPDGRDPRDSHVGRKRIDVPMKGVVTSGPAAVPVAQIRFNCLRTVLGAEGEPVHIRKLSVHLKRVPWE